MRHRQHNHVWPEVKWVLAAGLAGRAEIAIEDLWPTDDDNGRWIVSCIHIRLMLTECAAAGDNAMLIALKLQTIRGYCPFATF